MQKYRNKIMAGDGCMYAGAGHYACVTMPCVEALPAETFRSEEFQSF